MWKWLKRAQPYQEAVHFVRYQLEMACWSLGHTWKMLEEPLGWGLGAALLFSVRILDLKHHGQLQEADAMMAEAIKLTESAAIAFIGLLFIHRIFAGALISLERSKHHKLEFETLLAENNALKAIQSTKEAYKKITIALMDLRDHGAKLYDLGPNPSLKQEDDPWLSSMQRWDLDVTNYVKKELDTHIIDRFIDTPLPEDRRHIHPSKTFSVKINDTVVGGRLDDLLNDGILKDQAYRTTAVLAELKQLIRERGEKSGDNA